MLQENAEIVRSGFEAWDRQDYDAAARHFSPEVEIDASDRVLNPAVYTDIAGAMGFRNEIAETWDGFHVEIEGDAVGGRAGRRPGPLHWAGSGQRRSGRRTGRVGCGCERTEGLPTPRLSRPARSTRSRGADGVARSPPLQRHSHAGRAEQPPSPAPPPA